MTTYIEIEEACNYPWVATKQIRVILGGVSKTKADNFRMDLERKLDEEYAAALLEEDEKKREKLLGQCYYFKDCKPHRLPIKRVLEEAHIDLDFIRKEANKMRKAIKCEIQGKEV